MKIYLKRKWKIIVLITLAIAVSLFLFRLNSQNNYWNNARVDFEGLLSSNTRLISDVEYSITRMNAYLDKVHSFKSAVDYNTAVLEVPIIGKYEYHLITAQSLVDGMKKDEQLMNQILLAIQKRDELTFKVLISRLGSDVNVVNLWAKKYQEESDEIDLILNAKK